MKNTLVILLCISLLQGCAALVVGAGVGAASVAHDRRSAGTQLDDTTTVNRLSLALSKDKEFSKATRISTKVYNGVALLVGQAPTEQMREQAGRIASQVRGVKKVHNLIRLGQPIGAGTITNDFLLAGKVRTKLVTDKRMDGFHVAIKVEDSEVFLMGMVSNSEANVAVDVTRNVEGVVRVVKAFEIL